MAHAPSMRRGTMRRRMSRLWQIVLGAVSLAFAVNLSVGAAQPSDALAAYAALVGVHPDDARIPNEGEPRFGGVLHVAEGKGLTSLDNIRVPNQGAEDVYLHVAEGLFALDVNSNPAPQLIESYDVNDDGTVYTFTLRTGVPFHDGSVLGAADAVASIGRWLTGPTGRQANDVVQAVDVVSELTFTITLDRPFPYLLRLLSVPQNSALYILRAEQIEAAGDGDIGIPIGTGPYRVQEWRDGQFLHYVRFDGYVGRQEPPSGFAGGKVAYLDEIILHYVLDDAVRTAGVQANQYHIAKILNPDLYTRFEADAAFRTRTEPEGFVAANLNKRQGLMADPRIREAFSLAIDVQPIAEAAGPEAFKWLDSSWMPRDTAWHTTAGEDAYLAYDPERARQLLQEAGYDGQAVRWLVNPEIDDYYVPALIARPMLEAAGFNIDLRPMDHATIRTTRADQALWEVYMAVVSPRPEPTSITFFLSDYVGWYDSEEKNRLIEAMRMETDHEARFALWEDLERHSYEHIPLIVLYHSGILHLESSNYSGSWLADNQFSYVNSWLNE